MLRRPDYTDTVTHLSLAIDDATSEPEVVAAMISALDAALGATDVRPITDPLPATDLRLLITGPATRAYVAEASLSCDSTRWSLHASRSSLVRCEMAVASSPTICTFLKW